MLHDIVSLQLQGANFDELTELSLFYDKSKPKSQISCCKGAFYMGEMELAKVQLPDVLEK